MSLKRGAVILVNLLLVCSALTLQGQFTYITNADNSLTITSYNGPIGPVTIPTNINGLTVSGISSNAFTFNNNLTSVTIPGSVTNIHTDEAGFGLFMYCTNLTSATLGYGITSVVEDMFLMSMPYRNSIRHFGCKTMMDKLLLGKICLVQI
jgi:hypothetical protein